MLAANLWMPMPELWELRLGAVFRVEGQLRARLSGWRAESGERRAESGERSDVWGALRAVEEWSRRQSYHEIQAGQLRSLCGMWQGFFSGGL
jgi:hypothetical protein